MARPKWIRLPHMLRGERGAETMEFALVAPLLFLGVVGAIYALLAVSAQLSLSHAASAGARFASIPTDLVAGTYPDDAAVVQKVADTSPFFGPGSCTGSVSGQPDQNERLVLQVSCPFPNPLGAAVGSLLGSPSTGAFAPHLELSATATARRE